MGATLKQQLLAEKVVENRGLRNPKTMTTLMIESGYTPNTARSHQKQATEGKNFIELLNKCGASDKRIATVLNDGLNAKNGKKKDHLIRHRYAETIMKAKGLLKEQDGEFGSLANFIENMKGFDFEVLIAIKQRFSAKEPDNAPDNNGQ